MTIPSLTAGSSNVLMGIATALSIALVTYWAKLKGPTPEPFNVYKLTRTVIVGIGVGVIASFTGVKITPQSFATIAPTIPGYFTAVGGLDQLLKGVFRHLKLGVTVPATPLESAQVTTTATASPTASTVTPEPPTLTLLKDADGKVSEYAVGANYIEVEFSGADDVTLNIFDTDNKLVDSPYHLNNHQTPFSITGLEPGKTYTVKAFTTQNGISSAPATIEVTTKAPAPAPAPTTDSPPPEPTPAPAPTPPAYNPPGAVQDLSATVDGSNVTLTWNAPTASGDNGISRYLIYRGHNDNDSVIASVASNELTFTDPNVPAGKWTYYVTAFDGVKNTDGPLPPKDAKVTIE